MVDPLPLSTTPTPPDGVIPLRDPVKGASAGGRGTLTAVQRIDHAHRQHAPRRPAGRPVKSPPPENGYPQQGSPQLDGGLYGGSAAPPIGSEATDRRLPDLLLKRHAEDLVENLQSWASTLDRREAELNAVLALQENRERSFRVWAQSQRQQIEELERETKRLKAELLQQARRLAITAAVDSASNPLD